MIDLTYSSISECGPVRKINQDSIISFSNDRSALFCVADGMGGFSEGEKASKAITDQLTSWWKMNSEKLTEENIGKAATSLENVIRNVNTALFEYGLENEVCGSTVSILCICETKYIILAVGDSRIYLNHKRHFGQLTVDEIWSNMWIVDPKTGKKTPDPKYGMLLNAVGTEETIMAMRTGGVLEDHSMFLLCSDGLYKFCKEKYIKKATAYSKKAYLDERIAELKKQVVKNGEKDNMSVILIKVDDVRKEDVH